MKKSKLIINLRKVNQIKPVNKARKLKKMELTVAIMSKKRMKMKLKQRKKIALLNFTSSQSFSSIKNTHSYATACFLS